MAKSPLILAALAKDAVPQLDFVQAMPLTLGHTGHFDSALLTATDGSHYVLRQAANDEAALELDTELVVLRALAPFRSHFPFEITKLIGETRDSKGKRAHLFTYVYGNSCQLANLPATSPLAASIANALAAIHSLPLSVVENNGLPVYAADQLIRERTAEMDRFAATGRVSALLLNRWERALEDVNLWRFQPTVVHGNANQDNFLVLDEGVSGVLGWHSLQIGDPATDFALIQGTALDDFSYSALLEYERIKGADQNLRARAQLYSEFALGHYLLWAVQVGDEASIADAEKFLADLVTDIEAGLIGPIGPKPLGTDAAPVAFGNAPAEFGSEPMATAAGFVDAGHAIVNDDLLLTPIEYSEETDPAAVDASSASLFKPVVDSSYDHKNLFGETAPIPVLADDATAPIPVYTDDATAPITLPPMADSGDDADESDAEGEPKSGELF